MKFSICDLFLVKVIVAVCVAWWLDQRRQAEVNSRLEHSKSKWQAVTDGLSQAVRTRGWKVEIGGDENNPTLGVESPRHGDVPIP